MCIYNDVLFCMLLLHAIETEKGKRHFLFFDTCLLNLLFRLMAALCVDFLLSFPRPSQIELTIE